jgi:hypothetical protein
MASLVPCSLVPFGEVKREVKRKSKVDGKTKGKE